MKAGYAKVDITPPLGSKLAGYFQYSVSDGVFFMEDIQFKPEFQGKHNIFINRKLVNKMIVLKDKTDMSVSVITKIILTEFCKVISVNLNATACYVVKTADKVKQGRFSATTLTKHKNKTAVGQG